MRELNILVPASRLLLAVMLWLGAFVCFTSAYGAETPAGSGYALARGTNEFGVWAGGSPDSNELLGSTKDRNLFLLGLRYGRVLGAWDWFSVEYTVDLFPVALMFEPDNVRRGDSTIYGAGVSPVGFKLNFGQQSRIKPFIALSFGFLYFEKQVPIPDSSRFNFATEVGLGVQYFVTPKNAITLGYKLHHISNAGTADRNPGVDSHLFYAGYSFFTP
ncbi:MAG TPA: acyloxyacyl hydrolase [Candidatus Binatia bacterium]|nr:acyloxyacyl hydrolase [Candidatus Binatia bacterium]